MSPGQPSTQSCLHLCPPKVGTHIFFPLILHISPVALCAPPKQAHCPEQQLSPVDLFSSLERSNPPDRPPQGCAGASPSQSPDSHLRALGPARAARRSSERRPAGSQGRAGRGEEEEEGASEAAAGNRKPGCEQPGTGPGPGAAASAALCCRDRKSVV